MAVKNLPMREALRQALQEEMRRDENVFIMGEEVAYWQGTHKVTRGFVEEFGEKRVRDTPIAEMGIGGIAVGAAMAGLRPVAEFMTINFAFLALDAIINHAAKVRYFFDGLVKVPLVVRAAAPFPPVDWAAGSASSVAASGFAAVFASGSAVAGAGFAAPLPLAASPAAPIRAIAVPSLTSSPTSTNVADNTPSAGASTSTVALSASNSAITSPALTESPTFLSQFSSRPSIVSVTS